MVRPGRQPVETLEQRKLLSASAGEELVAAAGTSSYVAVLDATQNFGTTKRAVSFYDVTTLSGSVFGQQPLFSIWTGYEDASTTNFEDPQAITVDPATGDVYLSAFDSGTPGTVDTSADDTNGDFDLYRLDFAAALADFTANSRPAGTMYAPVTGPDGRSAGAHPDHAGTTVNLAGVSQKLGELARAQSSEFYDYDMEYAGDGRIVFLDNQTGPNSSGDTPANDHQIRLWERVSTSPGLASYDSVDNEGGWNQGTGESWESSIGALVNMDFDSGGNPVGRSEPVDIARVSRDGVEGVWVGESDGGGDDVGFFQIDWANQVAFKKELKVGTPPYPTSFALDENPVVDPNTNDGEFDWIITDANGDIKIGESGFFDTPKAEPKVISRAITDYDGADSDVPPNGQNEVVPGAWSVSANLPQPTNDDDGTAVTDGRFVTFDPGTGRVYYFDIDSGGGPNVVSDVYVFDPASGAFVYQEQNAANHFLERHGIRFFALASGSSPSSPAAEAVATTPSRSTGAPALFASANPITLNDGDSSGLGDGEEEPAVSDELPASL